MAKFSCVCEGCGDPSPCPGLVIPESMEVNIGTESHIVEAASWIQVNGCCYKVEILLSDTWNYVTSGVVAAFTSEYEYSKDYLYITRPSQVGGLPPDPNCPDPFACSTQDLYFKTQRNLKLRVGWRRKKITFYLTSTNITCEPDPTEPAPMVMSSKLEMEYKFTLTPEQHNINRCTTTHSQSCCYAPFDTNVENQVTEAAIISAFEANPASGTFYIVAERTIEAVDGVYGWNKDTQVAPCIVTTPCFFERASAGTVTINASDPNYDAITFVSGYLSDTFTTRNCVVYYTTDAGFGTRTYLYWDGFTTSTTTCRVPNIVMYNGTVMPWGFHLGGAPSCINTSISNLCFNRPFWVWPPGGPPGVGAQHEPICVNAYDLVVTSSRTAYTPTSITLDGGTWSTNISW